MNDHRLTFTLTAVSHTLKTYGFFLISSRMNNSCCTNHVQTKIKPNTGTFKSIGFHSRNSSCDSVTQVLMISDRYGAHNVFHTAPTEKFQRVNHLNAELNPICYLLALLVHHFLHVSRIRVKSLTLRLLMSYIYGAPILDVSRSHTTTHHSR